MLALSTQNVEYQRELAERIQLPFPVLSDERLELTRALRLPTFETSGWTLLKRLTLVIDDGRIAHVFYPIFPPDAHAGEVLSLAARLSGALADSEQTVFWLDSPTAPDPLPPLDGETRCDLADRRAAASRASGPRCTPRRTRTSSCSRGTGAGGERAGATAGSSRRR